MIDPNLDPRQFNEITGGVSIGDLLGATAGDLLRRAQAAGSLGGTVVGLLTEFSGKMPDIVEH